MFDSFAVHAASVRFGLMLPEEPLRPRLYLVARDEATVSKPTCPDPGIVLAVCAPFWAGVAWLLSAWL